MKFFQFFIFINIFISLFLAAESQAVDFHLHNEFPTIKVPKSFYPYTLGTAGIIVPEAEVNSSTAALLRNTPDPLQSVGLLRTFNYMAMQAMLRGEIIR